MRGLLRGIGSTVIAGSMVLTSLSSVFASTDVTMISTVDVNNAYVKTILSQNDSSINSVGRNVKVTDFTSKTIKNGGADTAVFKGESIINAAGVNVDVVSADSLTVDNSYANLLMNDTKSKIKTYSR